MIHVDVKSEVDINAHHGNLRPVIGAKHYEVIHADRAVPDIEDGPGWTFHNAPTMAFWNGKFYLQYIANPVGENMPPSRAMLTMSDNGRNWSDPRIAFPTYCMQAREQDSDLSAGESYSVMHHRMGFYLAPNGKFLTLGFYGISPEPSVMPNNGQGIGRVVREIGKDGSLGPIYFIRYNRHAGWDESNTTFPHYIQSRDAAFVEACDSCLADRLVTMQWWEEEQRPDGDYPVKGYKAMSAYRIGDQSIVGLWKWGKSAISQDNGESWSDVQDIPSLNTAGSKIWGQKLSDQTYAVVYNASPMNEHRWPLAILTSSDGVNYANIGLVQGEVPVRRYAGYYKFFGINYVKGLEVGSEYLRSLWLSYSMNKEDIWVSRIPVPIRYANPAPVHDRFDAYAHQQSLLDDWNLYIPHLAQIELGKDPSSSAYALRIQNNNSSDWAKAERIFPASTSVDIQFSIMPVWKGGQPLAVQILDGKSSSLISICFEEEGAIQLRQGEASDPIGCYTALQWHDFHVHIDLASMHVVVAINEGEPQRHALINKLASVERIGFRAGERWPEPKLSTKLDLPDQAIPAVEVLASSCYIRYVITANHSLARHDL
ncbi:conserved hypothetical protein [Paenibacillus curdlanolyticus YK9]|uniref:Sialidase domain-containing protein n=1 Tax=Paenibacillus curdlanolyticus YK9 TaxID=717606 RepID=E0I6D8_9BACL|nr:hypothetical protein [Paenibacillus curdlanolyticus]EFM11604.1 conserved hypothetical protein [Paenibacillus curdlanolyticus YK9]